MSVLRDERARSGFISEEKIGYSISTWQAAPFSGADIKFNDGESMRYSILGSK